MWRESTTELARRIRIHSLRMANRAQTSHIGSCLSCADILAVLYGEIMNYKADNPLWEDRDRLVLSKGHAGAALHATLSECGFFPVGTLDTHCQFGSLLLGHVSHKVPGVEVSTGSLGHGLSIGCGMALATRSRVFVLLSDGDLNEGATWEAAMFAWQHELTNLVAIVDYNRMQALGRSPSVLELNPIGSKWSSFGWGTWEIDGHDHSRLSNTIGRSDATDGPTCIIAHTIKGKGVSFMEKRAEWHYKSPSDKELEMALMGLGR